VDDVLLQLQPVGALHQRAELGADLASGRRRHLVVVDLDRDAQRFENQAHLERMSWKLSTGGTGK
jgi:hypothetical protein